MKLDRRNLLKAAAGASAANLLMPGLSLGAEDMPMPKSNRFLLYIHLGSSCGMAAGLIHPPKPGAWPLGYFQEGKAAGSNNPLMNTHVASGGLMFHDYLKFLAPMAQEMCLVNGTPQSLDHGVAKNLQTRGSQLATVSAEWSMSVGQFMRTEQRKNPMVLTDGVKAPSVAEGSDVLTVRRASSAWAYISLFYEWVKAAGLHDDLLIVVGQEFARSPYNKDSMNLNIRDASGKEISVNAAGRDHGLSMGTMFINPRVPAAGRIGHIGENMAPQGTKDAKGTIDTGVQPFTNPNIIGSMLMRVFDDLFPTERMVRKHWPDFVPIDQIIS